MDEKTIKFNLIGARYLWFIFSLTVVLAGVGSIAVRRLNVGIDFTGGRIIFYHADRKITASEVERVIRPFDIRHNPVQILGNGREFILRTVDYPGKKPADKKRKEELERKIQALRIAFAIEFKRLNPGKFILENIEKEITQQDIDRALRKKKIDPALVELVKVEQVKAEKGEEQASYNADLRLKGGLRHGDGLKKAAEAIFSAFGGHPQFMKEDKVDPLFGVELMRRATFTVLLAAGLILIYVAFRFEFWFAVAAVIALFHDCFITIGFYSILQLQVDMAFVAVILTVFGYSINDTIVIFDRIRENRRKYKREPLLKVMNYSLWETMARSVNTVLTVLITLLAIMLFGGITLKDFVTGMFVGVFFGCYSSIFVASPLAFVFKGGAQEEKRRAGLGITAEAPARESAKVQPPARKVAVPAQSNVKSASTAGTTSSVDAAAKEKKQKSGKKKRKKSRRR